VLVIRHATADAEISRQELLRSCVLQRNLTEAGREQARAIGEETVAEGETLVYGEGAELVGRVPAEKWAELEG
jgi:broad specificity phosphatase PhoE